MSRPVRLHSGLVMLLDAAEWAQQEILIKGTNEPATIELQATSKIEQTLEID
jgi:hypothetical protein